MTKRSYSFDLQEVTRAASGRSWFKKFLCASVIVFAICLISVVASLSLFRRGNEAKSKSSVNASAVINSSQISVTTTQVAPNYRASVNVANFSENPVASSTNSTTPKSFTGDSTIGVLTPETKGTTENSDVSSVSGTTVPVTDITITTLLSSSVSSTESTTTSSVSDIGGSSEKPNGTVVATTTSSLSDTGRSQENDNGTVVTTTTSSPSDIAQLAEKNNGTVVVPLISTTPKSSENEVPSQ